MRSQTLHICSETNYTSKKNVFTIFLKPRSYQKRWLTAGTIVVLTRDAPKRRLTSINVYSLVLRNYVVADIFYALKIFRHTYCPFFDSTERAMTPRSWASQRFSQESSVCWVARGRSRLAEVHLSDTKAALKNEGSTSARPL